MLPSDNSLTDDHKDNILILTIVQHQRFGYILLPYFSSYDEKNQIFSIVETARKKSTCFAILSEEEQKIISLTERYQDENLMKLYSREKNLNDFFSKIDETRINNFIRPLIETCHKEILKQIHQTHTPLFWKKRKMYIQESIFVYSKPSTMLFHFNNAEKFTYSAQIRNGEEIIALYKKNHAVLCSPKAIIVVNRQLHFFEDIDSKKLLPFFDNRHIEVPQSRVSDYIQKFVMKCVCDFEVIADGIDIKEITISPQAVVSIEAGIDLRLALHLKFRYSKHQFEVDSAHKKTLDYKYEDGKHTILWFQRNKEWEENRIKTLTDNGLGFNSTNLLALPISDSKQENNLYGIIEWINKNKQILNEFDIQQTHLKYRYFTGEIRVISHFIHQNDWFDFNCNVMFDEIEVPFVKLKNHIQRKVQQYILPDNSIAILPSEWFVKYADLIYYGKESGDVIKLNRQHFRIKELLEDDKDTNIKTTDYLIQAEAPPMLRATLRPYQLAGFKWLCYLHHNNFGGCLSDDMGLGKTLQTITLLLNLYYSEIKSNANGASITRTPHTQLSLFDEMDDEPNPPGYQRNRDLAPSLIVMPTSLISNWESELRKFAPLLQVYIHSSGNRLKNKDFFRRMKTCDIVITTYGTLRQDIDFISQYCFFYLILDESQNIKNPDSLNFNCIKQMSSVHKLALTGTPIENSLTDLWAQMDFLNEGALHSLSEFKKKYQTDDLATNENLQRSLIRIIQPFILRRTKEEVTPELPALTEEICYCEMTESQNKRYQVQKNIARNILLENKDSANKRQTNILSTLASLTRLRIIANHPAILDNDFEGESGKFTQIIEYAELLISEGHKILIFSSFVKHLRLIANYFNQRSWKYAWLTGETTKRQEEIERFNNDATVNAFFISLKAGGVGLNLTAADYVFILDPWWNPFAEKQAVSRAHRIGQNKKVTLYRFITLGTVEEKINILQNKKWELAESVVNFHPNIEDLAEILDEK